MFSYFEPNSIEKFLWESVLFCFFFFCNFGQSQNDVKRKSVIWPPFWNDTTFNFFSRIVIFYSPYMYGANFIAKFRCGKVVFSGGSMEPLLGINGSESTLGHFSAVSSTFICTFSSFTGEHLQESRMLLLFNLFFFFFFLRVNQLQCQHCFPSMTSRSSLYKNNIHNIYNNLLLHTHLTKIQKVIEIYRMIEYLFNGSQLAKMKKYIPYIPLP